MSGCSRHSNATSYSVFGQVVSGNFTSLRTLRFRPVRPARRRVVFLLHFVRSSAYESCESPVYPGWAKATGSCGELGEVAVILHGWHSVL